MCICEHTLLHPGKRKESQEWAKDIETPTLPLLGVPQNPVVLSFSFVFQEGVKTAFISEYLQ